MCHALQPRWRQGLDTSLNAWMICLSPPCILCIGFCLTAIGSFRMSRNLGQDRKQEIEVTSVPPVPLPGKQSFPRTLSRFSLTITGVAISEFLWLLIWSLFITWGCPKQSQRSSLHRRGRKDSGVRWPCFLPDTDRGENAMGKYLTTNLK